MNYVAAIALGMSIANWILLLFAPGFFEMRKRR